MAKRISFKIRFIQLQKSQVLEYEEDRRIGQ